MRTAWVVNLDAERELESGHFSLDSAARFARYFRKSGLLREGDVVVDGRRLEPGFRGLAWCPTPRALGLLDRAGASVPEAPPIEALRAVNHRAFATGLGDDLPGVAVVTSEAELGAALAFPASTFVLKRPFGFAGNGRRLVRPALDDADRAFVRKALAAGSLIVEPWVERVADFGLHGVVDRDGRLLPGEPTVQEVSRNGQWAGTRVARPDELGDDERERLFAALSATSTALRRAGYFGPFGLDAFRWVSESGQVGFRARCEINARYSMGWATGMGPRRPASL